MLFYVYRVNYDEDIRLFKRLYFTHSIFSQALHKHGYGSYLCYLWYMFCLFNSLLIQQQSTLKDKKRKENPRQQNNIKITFMLTKKSQKKQKIKLYFKDKQKIIVFVCVCVFLFVPQILACLLQKDELYILHIYIHLNCTHFFNVFVCLFRLKVKTGKCVIYVWKIRRKEK